MSGRSLFALSALPELSDLFGEIEKDSQRVVCLFCPFVFPKLAFCLSFCFLSNYAITQILNEYTGVTVISFIQWNSSLSLVTVLHNHFVNRANISLGEVRQR
jgi:hypothetical protein